MSDDGDFVYPDIYASAPYCKCIPSHVDRLWHKLNLNEQIPYVESHIRHKLVELQVTEE